MRSPIPLLSLASLLLVSPAAWCQVRGPEMVLNSTTRGAQWQPAVATAANGDAVVVWTEGGQRQSPSRIKARIFSGAGAAKTGEIRVSGPEAAYASQPSVAVGPTGDFIVVWRGRPSPDGSSQIFARRFTARGQPLAGAFLVSRCASCGQKEPDVARAPDGRFVVTWTELDGGFIEVPFIPPRWFTTDVVVRRFGADGRPLGAKQRVGYSDYGLASEPDVAMRSDGSFIVAFTWDDGDIDSESLADPYFVQFSADGTPGETVLVNQADDFNYQGRPALALRDDGRFAVLWVDEWFSSLLFSWTLFGQIFSEDGEFLGPAFRVSKVERYYEEGTAAWLPSGGLLVAWHSTDVSQGPSQRGYDVYLRQFTAQGEPVGQTDIPLNTFTPGNQSEPVIAISSNGQGIAVWQSMRRDGDDFGVAARRILTPQR